MTVQEIMQKIMGQTDEVAKAALINATMVSAGAVELDFAEMLTIVNDSQTPLLNTLGVVPVKAVTHHWREATVRSAAANKNEEGSAAKAPTSTAPAVKNNTCQIVKGTVSVSKSAIQEAQNGIYGTDLQDIMAVQVEMEMAGIMSDIENAFLYGVEDTTDAGGSERAMKGLIGAVGTWNGFIQTTRIDKSAGTFDQSYVDGLLMAVADQKPRQMPTALVGSLAFCQKVSSYATAQRFNISEPEQLANLTAGQRVTQYISPWGAPLEIIPHPMNTNSATEANNWFAAVCLPNMARGDFRSLRSEPLTSTADALLYEILWEGTLQVRNEKAFGLVYNFDPIS